MHLIVKLRRSHIILQEFEDVIAQLTVARITSAAEERMEFWQRFEAEANRRLSSRGPQLTRLVGLHGFGKNRLGLRIHSDETFRLVISHQHHEQPLGYGFASVTDGKLRLEFLEGEPASGSSRARELSEIVSKLDAMIGQGSVKVPPSRLKSDGTP